LFLFISTNIPRREIFFRQNPTISYDLILKHFARKAALPDLNLSDSYPRTGGAERR